MGGEVGAVHSVGVVGAGTMGSGIAQKLAQEGLAVVLVDRTEADLARGRSRIEATLCEGVERKILDRAAADQVLARIRTSTQIGDLAGCGLVIEAVFEDLAVKQELFRTLAEKLPSEAILATNTSSFYVRDLAAVTASPERVLGLHYFYHPAKNRLVEVVPHAGTSPAALAAARALQERIGKTPIGSTDAPGFVVNRFFVPWLNEAVRLLDEGVASIPVIERVAKASFDIGMGPFELMNVTGVPIALHAATTLGRELGAFYAPSARLAAQVAKGEPWPLAGDDAAERAVKDEVADRLLGVVFHVAATLVEEGVSSIEDTDLGARVGLRWAKGPFELMNRRGTREAARMAARAVAPFGLALPAALAERAGTGVPFPIEQVRLAIEGEVATITINRPDSLNALNEEVMEQLAARVREASAHADLAGIVIRGAGKAFVAGADVRWFVERIDHREVDRIVRFTERGQALFASFASMGPVVVAVLDGLSLGGGSELALACDWIVATRKASLGFPETGIGIYPGLGGTQRLPRRVGRGLARCLVLTGRTVDAEEARAIGVVDALVEPEAIDRAVSDLILRGKPGPRAPGGPLPERWQALATAFDRPVAELLAGPTAAAAGEPAEAAKLRQRLQHKAPVALRVADALVAAALDRPLAEGLREELAHLREVFGTKDARTGLDSVGRGRPTFVGA